MVVHRRIDPWDLDRYGHHGQTSQKTPAWEKSMKLLGLYLQEFNQTYRLTQDDRRRTRQTVKDFLATLAAILLLAFVLYAWQA